jgi:hypothetical protein
MRTPEMHSFDTHKYVKEFTKSGFKEVQAEMIVKSLLESREYDFSRLATKEQVASIEKDIGFIRQDMNKLATREHLIAMEERFMARLSASENTMLKWIIPLILTTWAMMAGIAFKLFSH